MTKRCTAWHIGGRKRFIECRVCGKARQRDDASIVPYKSFAAFIIIGKVSPRRDEGIHLRPKSRLSETRLRAQHPTDILQVSNAPQNIL